MRREEEIDRKAEQCGGSGDGGGGEVVTIHPCIPECRIY